MEAIIVLPWLIGCAAIAYIANERGRSMFVWFFVALFVSPVIAFAVIAAIPMRGSALMRFDDQIHQECRECSGPFRIGALRCFSCGAVPGVQHQLSPGTPGWHHDDSPISPRVLT